MTPKSLLRHPKVVSSLDELAKGRFQKVIPEPRADTTPSVTSILLCTGKLYYELEEHRQATKRQDVALVRLEQLYPLPRSDMEAALSAYSQGTPVIWVQEEPANMGTWTQLRFEFGETLFGRFPFQGITPPPAASPATGSHRRHKQEQAELLRRAFNEK
jgi:2-oxoglutarate dehydrogenase E1 component